MNPHKRSEQDLSNLSDLETPLPPLQRCKGTSNFSRLLSRRQQARSFENRLSTTKSRRSASNVSENSQILYMSASKLGKNRREVGRSFSSMANGRSIDGSADITHKRQDTSEDANFRYAIDREISEWQYVCQTGRPYWWSPESKYGRLQKLQQRMASEHDTDTQPLIMKTSSKAQSDIRRQTVSDSYLAEPSTFNDLAHLIAVQLLGACFTLPPDSITAVRPEYTRNEDGIAILKDPQMISSLRMHTHFRYSPSFGHQARNTSPVQLWPGRFDGPKSSYSPGQSNTGCTTPNIGTSSPCYRRPRLQRAPHNTEGSDTRHRMQDDEDYIRTCCDNSSLDPTVGACAWYRREGVHDSNERSFTLPHMPCASGRRTPTHSPERSRAGRDASRSAGSRAVKTNYMLQPVIRSEPHHVFIQPVRELVVKRWRKFRRRFSGSLHSSLPTGRSEEADSGSESSTNEVSSPLPSSGAKARRRRAQERGDIHSSSVDSTPHYNTPMSGHLSPANDERPQTIRNDSQNTTPTFRLADPLTAAASFVEAERTQLQSSGPSSPSDIPTPNSMSTLGFGRSTASSTLATCGTSHARSEMSSLPANSMMNTPSPGYSFSSQRSQTRPRRRSMLSEVYTPADLESPSSLSSGSQKPPYERNALSAMGSALASPQEEVKPRWPAGRHIDQVLSSPGPAILPTLGELTTSSTPARPRMSRTSTTGTQIFTPNEDTVEIDGLPVGPSREIWGAKRGRREHTYLY